MQGLTIEQKAKAYDEALKQIKECTLDENGFVTIYPNEIFPALKEREDEKIRKHLIVLFKDEYGKNSNARFAGIKVKDIIAWLEKQGEWSKEDEKMFNSIVVHLNATCGGFQEDEKWANKFLDWLKHLKNRVQPQNLTVTDEELTQAKKDAYNDALDKIEYHSGEPTFDDGWSAAIDYIRKKSKNSLWK